MKTAKQRRKEEEQAKRQEIASERAMKERCEATAPKPAWMENKSALPKAPPVRVVIDPCFCGHSRRHHQLDMSGRTTCGVAKCPCAAYEAR